MFADRTDAGRRLADALSERGVETDLVLAIPRGGLPVGRPVADWLGVPLDVVVARKVGAPGNPELAIGAVGSDGSVWLNDDLIERLDVDEGFVEAGIERETAAAREKAERYRGERPAPELGRKRVVIVDDGVATGATATACVRLVRAAGADRIVLAVPVGSPDTIESLRGEADDVVCVETPAWFSAVGAFYDDFTQVTDGEAVAYLRDESG